MSVARIATSTRAAALTFALGAAGAALAQNAATGVPNAMQGFSQNRDQPIHIEAPVLEVRDKKKEATFSGNVKVVQGDTVLTSQTLVVFYEQSQAPASTAAPATPSGVAPAAPAPTPANSKASAKSAPPTQSTTSGPGENSSIKRLEARGNVVVTQKDQVVTGDIAIFENKANLITMRGTVVVTQCKNVLRGDRLLVDMTTGVSRLESDSGRVQAMVDQSGQGCAPAPETPAPAPSAPNKPK
jgi:lipopolysaccharide export system protein LptA